jgi:signal peptidase I
MPVIKVIAGVPGDSFTVQNGILTINGKTYPLQQTDRAGKPLKRFYGESVRKLQKEEYILLSDYVPNSWDSRYWGPVEIKYIIKPLVVFHGK